MEEIKNLRERTGAGMVDCKKALDEAGGDLEKAVEILRKKGIAKAAKRGDRETKEGVIYAMVNEAQTEGYIIEINSETDFVARNEKFQEFAKKALEVVKANKPVDLEALLSSPLDGSSVREVLDNLSGVIGEKLELKRFDVLSGESVAAYLHLGGKIGVLVALDQAGQSALAVDVAMQIAAANPRYINSEDVVAEELEKEKEIYREQLLKEGKPENIINNILQGKVNKFYSENCLMKQEYIKDEKITIEQLLKGIKVSKFIRYSLQ